MFFEGSEKKLEICLRSGAKSLLSYDKKKWERVVQCSRAQILSEIKNDEQIAYLLSESSLFLSADRLVMITCGKTTLAHALLEVLRFVPESDVAEVFYERKKEVFPEYQRSNFYQDVKLIKDKLDGDAFRFGTEDDHHIYLFHTHATAESTSLKNGTLEILMHGLEREVAQIFCEGYGHTRENINLSGVRSILPGYEVDDFIFQPMGYSLNAIKSDKYYTIHITPQELGSYVSFETNHDFSTKQELDDTVKKVLSIFKPSSINIFQFESPGAKRFVTCDYHLKTQVLQELSCGYEVGFFHYYRQQKQVQCAEKLEIDI